MQGHYELRQSTPDISLDQAAEALGGQEREISELHSAERYFGVPETGSP